jgi:hypothetical protein
MGIPMWIHAQHKGLNMSVSQKCLVHLMIKGGVPIRQAVIMAKAMA